MTRAQIYAVPLMVILLACVVLASDEPRKGADSALAKPEASNSADALARKVVTNELKAEDQDQTRWMYRVEHDEPGKSQIKEVVETKEGALERRLFLNGQPLTPEELKKEDERIQRVCTDPRELQKLRRERQQDGEQARHLLKLLPDAFNFSYAGRQRDVAKLNFKPNPKFKPPSREAHVFHDMAGSIWVNTKELRLAGIDGQLTQEVKFGGGLLGHLDKGGYFQVKQTEVAAGHWDMTFLEVNMNGKALIFKTIAIHEKELLSDFRRVPDTLTLEQAANLLKQQTSLTTSH